MTSSLHGINTGIDTSSFFNSIIANSTITNIMVMDISGEVLFVNDNFKNLTGYDLEEIAGKHLSILFTPEDVLKGLPQQELQNVLLKGSALDDNYILTKDQKKIWCTGESIFIKGVDREPYIVKILHNIDKHKTTETDLERLNQKLSVANEEMNNFVYIASHDLKSPISNMEGILSILENIENDNPQSRQMIELLRVSTEKFKTIINDLSAIGKISEESRNITSINVSEVFEEVKDGLTPLIETFKAEILTDFKVLELKYSLNNLRSIISNLLSNSIKYSNPERPAKIRLTTEPDGNFFKLKVEDNGLGIKEVHQQKIFTLYKRFHDHVPGSGVGLALVKRILDATEGKIQIQSKEGEGSIFTVLLKQPELSM